MNNKTKVIIAVVLFVLAAVVIAYQFGIFGESAPKQPSAEVQKATEGTPTGVIEGSGSKPTG